MIEQRARSRHLRHRSIFVGNPDDVVDRSFGPGLGSMPELQLVVVCGPRIDPASLPRRDGVQVHGYLPDLYRHLAACDPDALAAALVAELRVEPRHRPVETGGAARAGQMLAELL